MYATFGRVNNSTYIHGGNRQNVRCRRRRRRMYFSPSFPFHIGTNEEAARAAAAAAACMHRKL